MKPAEFKQRYLEAIPQEVPAQLREELAEFIDFDAAQVQALPISEADRAILAEVGLPRNAPPFLNFGGGKIDLLVPLDGFSKTALIGFTGFGDPICLDLGEGGAVVLLNRNDHNAPTTRTVMNTSVAALAHCLCGFAEYRASGDADAFLAGIAMVDDAAAGEDSWWVKEITARQSVA